MRAIYRKSDIEFFKIIGKKVIAVSLTPSFFEQGYIKHLTPAPKVIKSLKKLPVARKKEYLKVLRESIKQIKY